jgi:hypothetical protein
MECPIGERLKSSHFSPANVRKYRKHLTFWLTAHKIMNVVHLKDLPVFSYLAAEQIHEHP